GQGLGALVSGTARGRAPARVTGGGLAVAPGEGLPPGVEGAFGEVLAGAEVTGRFAAALPAVQHLSPETFFGRIAWPPLRHGGALPVGLPGAAYHSVQDVLGRTGRNNCDSASR